MTHKDLARQQITNVSDDLIELSHQLHANPEIAYAEHNACKWVSDRLSNHGFDIDSGVAGLPTGFRATIGDGSLHIAICAEYDALPGLGHACGHNLIAAMAVGAAIGLLPLIDELDLKISVFGTPAEEGGGGKILMLQRGAFDGINAAMMVHAGPIEREAMKTLSVSQYLIDYHGKAAHAAASPHDGISASAAMTLAQVGIGMLREHIHDGDRIHGIVTKGGDAPNIVPSHTQGRWFVRSTSTDRLVDLEPRVSRIFEGAAVMTGCSHHFRKGSPSYSEMITHPKMAEFWRNNVAVFGRNALPIQASDGAASTDMGNVSFAVPSIHPMIAIDSQGANIHEPEFERSAISESADQAIIDGSVGMAWTIIDMATDGLLRSELTNYSYNSALDVKRNAAYLGLDCEVDKT